MLSRRRLLLARALAVLADAIQLGFMPLFVEGAASPVNAVLDVVMAITMISLVGWHWAFAPAFLVEMLPIVDIAPTWTIAVLLATRGATSPSTVVIDRPPRG